MNFKNQSMAECNDPFSFIEARRVPRSSMESDNSRRSIPICPRPASLEQNYLTQNLFPCNQYPQINVEVVQLKDESKFEKLFDDDEDSQNMDNTMYSSDQQMSMTIDQGLADNRYGSFNDSCGTYPFQVSGCSSNVDDETVNVEEVLGTEIIQNNILEEKHLPFVSMAEIQPIISPEANTVRTKKTTHSPTTSSGGVRRRKKTVHQVNYLTDLYNRLGGKWDGKVRKEAMLATGLSRIQIYKWFFDRQLQEKGKNKDQSTKSHEDLTMEFSSEIQEPEQKYSQDGVLLPPFTVEKLATSQ